MAARPAGRGPRRRAVGQRPRPRRARRSTAGSAATVGPDAADRLPGLSTTLALGLDEPVDHLLGPPPPDPPRRPSHKEPRHDHHDPDLPRRQLRPRHRGGDRPSTCPSPAACPPSWPAACCASAPTPCGRPTPPTYHWFIGDGMVHGVRLRRRPGRVVPQPLGARRRGREHPRHRRRGPHVRPGRGRRAAGRADRRARHDRELPTSTTRSTGRSRPTPTATRPPASSTP